VLVDDRHEARVGVGGRETLNADRGVQLVEAGDGGLKGGTGGGE